MNIERKRVAFKDLRVGDRVCFKSRKGAAGGGVSSLLFKEDGSLLGFRLEGEKNPGVYYQEMSFICAHRDVPLVEDKRSGMFQVSASSVMGRFELELDSLLKENDHIDIEGREYYVYGTPVLVMKSGALETYKLDCQLVNLELR